MKLKSFHKTEGHNTPKNTSNARPTKAAANRLANGKARASHQAQVFRAAADSRARHERSGLTDISARDVRRAALYDRRARQLFFYKAFVIILIAAGCGIFFLTRFSGTAGSTKQVANMTGISSSELTSYADAQTGTASSLVVAQDSQDATLPTGSDAAGLTSVPISDYDAFLEHALAKCSYLADLTDTATYQITGDVARSAVASSFFKGFTPLETDQTVKIPANKTPSVAGGTGSTRQGSDDDYEDSSGAASDSSEEDVFLDSESAVLINLDTGEIVAERNADKQVYPASMTKVLSMLCAEEQITDRDKTFTITRDITDLTFSESLSSVCWDVGEKVTLPDLEYGTILHSGADAAIGMARYSVGSEEALVALMNERTRAMGLSEKTHFTNVTGQFDENQTVTVTDMAMIMKAAVENERMLEVMRTGEYRTSGTPQHPDGVYIFNKFLDRTQNTKMRGEIVCVKTGYTIESLNCAVSYYVSESGGHYVCVTALGNGSRRVVTDHVNLCETYAK